MGACASTNGAAVPSPKPVLLNAYRNLREHVCCCDSRGVEATPLSEPCSPHPHGDFEVSLKPGLWSDREGGRLGLAVDVSTEPAGLLVRRLFPQGWVPSYNEEHKSTPEQQIRPGDVIIAVGTVFGDTHEMRTWLWWNVQYGMDVELTMKRGVEQLPSSSDASEEALDPVVARRW
eukprot:TRINITY_DN50486_c0_g1_i1.p1 TRINITY_DN50486_c0_g1~~TRINITY_DN50486_c0_g1_i1.p1  ORF type:complete len:175 (-),score=18.42 TRINITY_DN50486_c0_g1_i1:376-900(-)